MADASLRELERRWRETGAIDAGTAIYLESQTDEPGRWSASLSVEDAAELDRLRADGHSVTRDKRDYSIVHTREAIRSTQLYRALGSERLRALGLPTNPDKHYATTGWTEWADYLGNEGRPQNAPRAKDAWLPFDEARHLTRENEFFTLGEFKAWVRANPGCKIPINPHLVYAEQWKGGGDWIGIEKARGGGWGTYENAVKWARGLNLGSKEQWEQLRQGKRLPFWVPATPEQAYAGKGWVDWTHWLVGDTTDILARVDDTGLEDREVERAAGLRAGFLGIARRGKLGAGKRGLSARCWARLQATLEALAPA